MLVHGIAMRDEYPRVAPLPRFERTGRDGPFEKGLISIR